MLVSPSNPDALSRRLLAKLQEDRSGNLDDSCIDQIDGNTPQADMEIHDGLGTSSEKAEEEEKENTVAVAVTADATDTAAVTELSNNYLRELWEWADNFRIDSARWERADTKGEMVPIPPALTVRNWKKLMRTIKGSEDAEENRKVGEDGWINPIHPIQCKNDYLDIFYNWMANFDLGKCYWMVNDAADKAIPRPPAVHESILWRMKNHDRQFTISGPPPGAWKFKKEQARMRFGKKSEIKRKSWRSKAN